MIRPILFAACAFVLVALWMPARADDAASSASPRRILKEVVVDAPAAEVWRVWTTGAGAQEFFAPHVRIDLRVGGDFEVFFNTAAPEGERGSEGCHVLSYLPEEMISFEWNFPPKIPALRAAGAHTFVVVQLFDAGDGKTRVRLTHLGWQEGEDWDKGLAYFDKAWPWVLGNLQKRFVSGPIDWNAKE